jgi:hypothetical protein
MSRRGDGSVSEEERRVMVGAGGSMDVEGGEPPSDLLDRKPVLKRLFLLSMTGIPACGGSGIGEESGSLEVSKAEVVRVETDGSVTSAVETSASGVCSVL